MKVCYNYKSLFEEPVKVRKILWIPLAVGIELSLLVLAGVIVLLMYVFFNGCILFINDMLPGSMLVIYIFVPYKLSKVIFSAKSDGQKLPLYLKDLFLYYMQIVWAKKCFCQDEPVELSKQMVFESVEW